MFLLGKVFRWILLLLVFSSKLHGQTFTTAGCGQDKTCFFRPTSCSTSENCDFLITFKATTSSKVDFELSGKANWVSVGFSSDQTMPDTDILMCVSNPTLSGHYYAADRVTPARTSPTPSAVTVVEQAFENGVTKCRISRDLNPSITNFRDLNQEVFLLAAIGGLSGSSLRQHSTTVASNVQINVTQVTALQTMQGGQQGSFRIPGSCTSSADCDFLVTYQPLGEDRVVFEISGRNNWAGVGFSNDDEMPDTDMLLCVSNQALSGHYYASGRTTPVRTAPTPSVEILEQSFENGVISCRISRVLNPEINNFRDLNADWFLLGAIGPLSGNTIRQHNVRGDSGVRIRVTEGGDITGAGGGGGPSINGMLAHAIMMTFAWILFAPVGIFTARYMREVWEPTEICGKKAWFTVHRTLMSTTVVLTIAATVVIFVDVKAWSQNAGPHPFLGIVTIGFALIQPIMAALRPHPGAPRRVIFNWVHRIVGVAALVLAVISIYFGLATPFVNQGEQGQYPVIAFSIGIYLAVAFVELYLNVSKRNKNKRSVSVANTGDIPLGSPGHDAQQLPEKDSKEAMIRTMVFVFVLLVGAGVTQSIISILGLNF